MVRKEKVEPAWSCEIPILIARHSLKNAISRNATSEDIDLAEKQLRQAYDESLNARCNATAVKMDKAHEDGKMRLTWKLVKDLCGTHKQSTLCLEGHSRDTQ